MVAAGSFGSRATKKNNHMQNNHRPNNRPLRNPNPSRAFGPKTCGLYAILLDASVINDPKYRSTNPGYVTGMPHYYVGASSQAPAKRYRQHKDGRYNSSRIACRYGLQLCESVVPSLKPMCRKRAYEQERMLAKRLRAAGNGVWQA